jgi:hypothetical protein
MPLDKREAGHFLAESCEKPKKKEKRCKFQLPNRNKKSVLEVEVKVRSRGEGGLSGETVSAKLSD